MTSHRIPAANTDGAPERVTAEPIFDITRDDWRVVAEDAETKGEARVRFWYKGQPFREIHYPAYKVWNIPAHLHDIAADFEHGMSLASWTGFPCVVFK